MAGARFCWLLLLLAALLLSAAAPVAGSGLRITPSLIVRDRASERASEEGSGDAAEEADDAESRVALDGVQEKQDTPDTKILDANVPDMTQAFFNYGVGFALLTYITMGIGYFYGPYSVDAYLADERAKHRIHYLEQRLNLTDEQQAEAAEHDYGQYVEEEVDSLLEHGSYGGQYGGYGGGHGGYEESHHEEDGGYGQDSYTTYEGQIARRRGVAAVSGQPPRTARFEPSRRWRAESRRGRPHGAGRDQQRFRPAARRSDGPQQRPRQQQRYQADRRSQTQQQAQQRGTPRQGQQTVFDRHPEQHGGIFKIFRQPQPVVSQSQRQDSRPSAPQRQDSRPSAPQRQSVPPRRGPEVTSPQTSQPPRGSRPTDRRQSEVTGDQQVHPASYAAPGRRPVLTQRQRQRQPVYRPVPAPRPAVIRKQPKPDTAYKRAPEPASAVSKKYRQPGSQSKPAPGLQPKASPAIAKQRRPVAPAEQPAAEEERGAAVAVDPPSSPKSAGSSGPPRTDRQHTADGRVDLVKLVAAVDTTHPECRAWIRCLQNARHPQTPLLGRRGRREDEDCSRYIATCPAKQHTP